MKVGPQKNHQTVKCQIVKQQELLRFLGGIELTPHSGSSKLHICAVCATFRRFSNTFRS